MSQQNVVLQKLHPAVAKRLPGTVISQSGEKATTFKAEKGIADLSRMLLHVAWMAVLLGLIIEALILIVAASFDKAVESSVALADLVQKVSWLVVVCTSLAMARSTTNLMTTDAQVATVGFVGLLTTPMAFAIARSLHEGVQEALFIKIFQTGIAPPVLLALIKGIEYGCLGAMLVWVGKKASGQAVAHAGTGFIVGTIFGGVLIAVMAWGAKSPMTSGALLSHAINEIINPVGCSLILYSARILERTQIVRDQNPA